jgi:hypothetical protein
LQGTRGASRSRIIAIRNGLSLRGFYTYLVSKGNQQLEGILNRAVTVEPLHADDGWEEHPEGVAPTLCKDVSCMAINTTI